MLEAEKLIKIQKLTVLITLKYIAKSSSEFLKPFAAPILK